MATEVICALIGGAVTLVGSVLAFIISLVQLNKSTKKSQAEQLQAIETKLTDKLEEHREEYLKGIEEVHNSINEFKTEYFKKTAVIELKIDNLEKKQDKHNNVIERTYKLEKDVAVLENKSKVSEHRLDDLEKK